MTPGRLRSSAALSRQPFDRLCHGRGSTGDSLAYSESRLGWLRDSDQEAAVGSFRIKQPHHFTFLIALLLAIVGVASTRFQIKYVSAHAFWFVVAAYVVLALGTLIDGL